ncbi:MAG TPA: hypothetical protein P5572_17480, partial [Phycisphaerae bacterium]|nr:hypothetical protein [Phycisphaerae bacterium]
DNSQGTLVGGASGESCLTEAVSVRLEADKYYLVRVSGTAGAYRLTNGVTGDPRKFPLELHDRIYDILHPGDPIEFVIRYPEVFAFLGDPVFSALHTTAPDVHLELFDIDSALIAEGVASGGGERLSLAQVAANQVYALRLSPAGAEATADITWDSAAADATSPNLIFNPGAEDDSGDSDGDFPGWTRLTGDPRNYLYNAEAEGPSLTDPGPDDRGLYLFAGGPNSPTSQLQQTVLISSDWWNGIAAGRVQFHFAAFLGGSRDATDAAGADLTFYNDAQENLGEFTLPEVTSRDRDNTSGLLPVEVRDFVPAGATYAAVTLTFVDTGGNYNYGFADNVELELSEYVE